MNMVRLNLTKLFRAVVTLVRFLVEENLPVSLLSRHGMLKNFRLNNNN